MTTTPSLFDADLFCNRPHRQVEASELQPGTVIWMGHRRLTIDGVERRQASCGTPWLRVQLAGPFYPLHFSPTELVWRS